MDVSKFEITGEWLAVEIDSAKDIGELRFKVKPLSSTDQIMIAEQSEGDPKKFLKKVEGLVVDWDLEKDGQPLPCTEENKAFYMPYLIGMKIKKQSDEEEEKKEEGKIVGTAIIEFAQDFGNFTKN